MTEERRIGGYRLLRALAQGGMGVVYLAEHVVDGRKVALKTVRVPHEGHLAGIRREIVALRGLEHPGIVRVLDEGVEAGVPWYAMELLPGKTLRHHVTVTDPVGGEGGASPTAAGTGWDVATTHPLSPGSPRAPSLAEAAGREADPGAVRPRLEPERLRSLLTFVRRLCAPLSYMHGEGLVHRDLKPDNVLVNERGWPVIVDFGLVSRFAGVEGREMLDVTGVSGTAPYMAPEQVRGDVGDARADIYALGCILFELLTGRPPFVGASPVSVLWQHVNKPPEVPSLHADGVPPAVDALVLRLLAKEPRDRVGYADAVATALGEAGAEMDVADETSLPAPSRPYLYRPGLTGRDAALAPLRALVSEQATAGAGRLALLAGEAGSGKTRLLVELGRMAVDAALQVVAGSFQDGPAHARRPLQGFLPVLQLVADRCRAGGADATRQLLGSRGSTLVAYEPSLRDVPGADGWPPPVPLAPEEGRVRLFAHLSETLRALAAGGSLLVLLDDLHWADELSLGFLAACRRDASPGARPCIVGSYRQEEGEALRDLLEGVDLHLVLSRLGRDGVAAMVKDMLALSDPPGDVVAMLVERSEGIPLYVAEYLRGALAGGAFRRDGAGAWELPPIDAWRWAAPATIADLLARRLGSLPETARPLLELLALMGREAPAWLPGKLADGDESRALVAVQALVSRGVLEAGGPSTRPTLTFAHDGLREAAAAAIPEGRRRAHHRALAGAVHRQSAYWGDAAHGIEGHHWEQAGEPARARACYLEGARRAVAAHASAEAERLYRAYLAIATEPDAESVAARNELGERVLLLKGRTQDALREHAQALAGAVALRSVDLQGACHLALGRTHQVLGAREAARREYEQALSLCRTQGLRWRETVILSNVATLLRTESRMEEARAVFAEALAVARAIPDVRQEAVVLGNLGILEAEVGELASARGRFQEALATLGTIGDRLAEGIMLGNLANVLSELGDLDGAERCYRKALAIHRDIGDVRSEGRDSANLAWLCHRRGRLPEALDLYGHARRVRQGTGERGAMGLLGGNEALVLMDLGRLEDARARVQDAVETLRACGERRHEGGCLLGLAWIERRAGGDLGAAMEACVRAEAIARERGDRVEVAKALAARGHVVLASGGRADAELAAVRTAVTELRVSAGSELAQALGRLERAHATAAGGLVAGEDPADVPDAVKAWRRERGIGSGR